MIARENLRRIEIEQQDGSWVVADAAQLEPGDICRMFEPDGTPVAAGLVFVAESHSLFQMRPRDDLFIGGPLHGQRKKVLQGGRASMALPEGGFADYVMMTIGADHERQETVWVLEALDDDEKRAAILRYWAEEAGR